VTQAQQYLDSKLPAVFGLDAGPNCRPYGCSPRVWTVHFDAPLPAWKKGDLVLATLAGWDASGAVVENSHLHHGRFGFRWKSSNGRIAGNKISARYMQFSPLEYYMEGPFRLDNISVVNNTFNECAPRAGDSAFAFGENQCDPTTHLPLGPGGAGGVCQKLGPGGVHLVSEACSHIAITNNCGYRGA
jgi:hypothetical protein